MVNVNAGPEAVRAYVREQASRGLQHVRSLVRADLEEVLRLIEGLDEEQAAFSPGQGEFSVSQVIQHLNGSFQRSKQRLETLSSGRPWQNSGPGPGPGSIPEPAPASFAEAREEFRRGASNVLSVLDRADPEVGLELTAEHPTFGAFNWLEWAVYSHHVHTHDHIGQIRQIESALAHRTGRP